MGRQKIYRTELERREAQRRWQREYYYRNRDTILNKARKKYRAKKQEELKKERRLRLYGE